MENSKKRKKKTRGHRENDKKLTGKKIEKCRVLV